jgi:peptide/nickel transport system permease protein
VVLLKYPVRLAINPIISSVGFILPQLFAGAGLISIVLSLPTIGPLLFVALHEQDMYLAGTILMIYTSLILGGTLISDVLLAWVDPRIRYGGGMR